MNARIARNTTSLMTLVVGFFGRDTQSRPKTGWATLTAHTDP